MQIILTPERSRQCMCGFVVDNWFIYIYTGRAVCLFVCCYVIMFLLLRNCDDFLVSILTHCK
jgi:hypothetical protein